MASILKVLQLNPFVPWDYFVLGYQLLSETRGLVWLTDCAGYREPVKRGIASLMITDPANPGFDKLAKEVNPVALIKPMPVEELENDVEAVLAWEILIDPTAPVAPRSDFADIVGQHMWGLDNSRHNYNYQWYDNQVAS